MANLPLAILEFLLLRSFFWWGLKVMKLVFVFVFWKRFEIAPGVFDKVEVKLKYLYIAIVRYCHNASLF
jgi:hypothetical protein